MQKFIALKSGVRLIQGETYEGTIVDGYAVIPKVGTFCLDLFKPVKKYPYIGKLGSGKLVLFLGRHPEFDASVGVVLKPGHSTDDPVGMFYETWAEDAFEPLADNQAAEEASDILAMYKYLKGN